MSQQQPKPVPEPVAEKPKRVIPPREPHGESEWRVTIRHSPLKVKWLVVKATGRQQAWQKFLEAAEAKTTPDAFRGTREDAVRYEHAKVWLAAARQAIPDGVEIIGSAYRQARLDALRVKGTVTIEDIGFPELASARS